MKSASIVLTFILILFAIHPASAHHAFAAIYASDRVATIQGTITEVQIRNPHSFISLNVTDPDGKAVSWGIEWGSVSLLGKSNIGRGTLKVGDKVTIIGAPTRNTGDRRLLMQKIRRPTDGWSWGYQPGEAVPNYQFPL